MMMMAASCLTRALRSLTLSQPALLSPQVNARLSHLSHLSHHLKKKSHVAFFSPSVLTGGRPGQAARRGRTVQRFPHHGPSGAEQDILEAEGEVHRQARGGEKDRRQRSLRYTLCGQRSRGGGQWLCVYERGRRRLKSASDAQVWVYPLFCSLKRLNMYKPQVEFKVALWPSVSI